MDVFLNVLKWSAAAGAAVGAVLALRRPLDRRFSPKWRYFLWLVLSAALLLSPVRWERFTLSEPVVELSVPEVRLPVYRPGTVDRTYSDGPPKAPAASPASPASPVAPVIPEAPASGPEDGGGGEIELSHVVVPVWLAGAAVFLIWHVAGTALLSRRVRRWRCEPGRRTVEICESLCEELGLRRPSLAVSRNLASPMVTGLLSHRLWLPRREYGERELEFILRHELTHIKRRDLGYKLLILCANALHWFNPLIWLLRRDAGETVELLCDAQAMAGADDADRRDYCEALLANISRERGTALTTHFYGGVRSVKNRFRNLLDGRDRKYGWTVLIAVLTAVAVCAGAVGLSRSSGGEDPAAPGDGGDTAPQGFAVKLTGPASPEPALEGEGGYLDAEDLAVTADGVSFRVYASGSLGWCLSGLRDLAVYDPARDGSWEARRENTTENREALDRRFQVYVNGQKRPGGLIYGQGSGHQDYEFRFDVPLAQESLSGAEVYIAVGRPLWVADHGLVYAGTSPFDPSDHCDVYYAEDVHIYYLWQSGVMHGGVQELIAVWDDGRWEEYLSKLPPLGEYEFNHSYYAQDISLSSDGLSLRFSAPDYAISNGAFTDNGPAAHMVDLKTGELFRDAGGTWVSLYRPGDTSGQSEVSPEPVPDPADPPEESTPLGAEELSLWQERLNTPEWKGFVSQFYRAPAELDLYGLLRQSGGTGRDMTASERAALGPVEGDVHVFDRDMVDTWLREKTGAGLGSVTRGIWRFGVVPGSQALTAVPEDPVSTQVRVPGGLDYGAVKTLTVEDAEGGFLGTLMVEDGKIVSFTNAWYNALIDAADIYMQSVEPAFESASGMDAEAQFGTYYLADEPEGGYQVYRWTYDLVTEGYTGPVSLPLQGLELDAGPAGYAEDGYCAAILHLLPDGTVDFTSLLSAAEAEKWDQSWQKYVDSLWSRDEAAVTAVQRACDGLLTGDYGYIARVTYNGSVSEHPITPETAYYDGDTLRQTLVGLDWTEPEGPSDPEGITVELVSPDGQSGIGVGLDGGPVTVTSGGQSRLYGLSEGDLDTLRSTLYSAADFAAGVNCVHNVTAPGSLTSAEALKVIEEKVAENYRSLPQWVEWRPADFAVSDRSRVFDEYYGEPEQFCADLEFYIKLANEDEDSPARIKWEVGSGLGERVESGRYEGYYPASCQCLVMKNGDGDWALLSTGSGGYSVNIPEFSLTVGAGNYLGDAPLATLLGLLLDTHGFTHDVLLPDLILSKPYSQLEELEGLISPMSSADAQNVCAALYFYLSASEGGTVKTHGQLIELLGGEARNLGPLAGQ